MLAGGAAPETVHDVVSLSSSDRFKQHMAAVDEALSASASAAGGGAGGAVFGAGGTAAEDDPEYKLVVASNDIAVEIEDEAVRVHRFVADSYSGKFPELEQIVPSALDYCRVVQAVGNEMDLTVIDLNSLLPPSQVMVVSVSGSTTSGKPLDATKLARCLEGCALLLELDAAKTKILRFVESRMSRIAPNLSALLGTGVAAALVGLAGGLVALSKIPACNLQVIGQKKRTLSGFSSSAIIQHVGLIYHAPLIQAAPAEYRKKAVRVLAGKVALAARSDTFQNPQSNTGSVGMKFHAEIQAKIAKWQEPPPARAKKALKKPDDMPARKRGGKRLRRQKEKFGLTDVHKEAQRLHFASDRDEYSDAAMGLTFGALGKEGSGRLRQMTTQREKKAAKQAKQAKQQAAKSSGSYAGSSGMQTSGLSSSLAFTPFQGLELQNPNAAAERVKAANEKYFSAKGGGFASVKPK